MTPPTPAIPLARIGSDAPELLIPSAPPLTLVRDRAPAIPRGGWIPIVGSALVVASSFFAAPALSDSLTGKVATGAALRLTLAYKALAPLTDTLDTISLFSQRQHAAFLLTCAIAFSLWRALRKRTPCALGTSLRCELAAAAKGLIVLLGVYSVGALVPRPTARLAMSSSDDIVVDFHSHTRYSWDGRAAFSPEASRRWHRASGFDVAYITDHSTFAGAEEAAVNNPARANDGTVMLSGIEVRDRGNHLVVLGTDGADWRSYTAGDLQEHVFQRDAAERGSARPVVLFTLPGKLKAEPGMSVDGIELSDAAPRGLSQSDAEGGAIDQLARDQNKTLVASSNNHGWASASPAWSVMHIPNWRAMTPAQLDIAIRREILLGGLNAVRVIDRRTPAPVSVSGVTLTVPDAAWRMLTTMSWPERASWLAWIWFSYLLVFAARRVRHLRNVEEAREWKAASALIS